VKIKKNIIIAAGMAVLSMLIFRFYFPQKAHIGNQNHVVSNQKIVIIPMAGIPTPFLQSIEKTLEEQHRTNVLVTTGMGKGRELLIEGGDQYNSNALAGVGKNIGKNIGREGAFLIVLTNEDINYPDSGLRYLYSAHYQGLSVVSLARINPLNYGIDLDLISIPEKFIKMKKRALKLINKSIGYGVYGYGASSDMKSVMYGPIMGPADLDKVGEWY